MVSLLRTISRELWLKDSKCILIKQLHSLLRELHLQTKIVLYLHWEVKFQVKRNSSKLIPKSSSSSVQSEFTPVRRVKIDICRSKVHSRSCSLHLSNFQEKESRMKIIWPLQLVVWQVNPAFKALLHLTIVHHWWLISTTRIFLHRNSCLPSKTTTLSSK